MPPSDLENSLLAVVRDAGYKPAKPRALARLLGLDQEGAREMKRLIKKLVKRGTLSYGSNHLVSATRPDSDRSGQRKAPNRQGREPGSITGIFRRLNAGYGFVRPKNTAPAAGRREDIYIAAVNAGDASTGDTVLVRMGQKPRRGLRRLEGEIVEIVDRETNQFVGTYFEKSGEGLVQVDGKLFSQPIFVGDPGAKGVRVNDKVVLEMVRFPSHTHGGEGVLAKVLGARGAPGVDTESIIHEFNLPQEFPEDALEEARQIAAAFDETIDPQRKDFTGLTTVTIDPVDARDFDDAISLEPLEGGHWQLGVHIADVGHFVPIKTALDREARDRGTSVYLPDRVIPMLPEIISNNLASLQPEHVRYTLSAMIEMDAEGMPIDCQVHQGAIRSDRRFTYEEIDDFLANPQAWTERLPAQVHALIVRMHQLAMKLRQRRMHRGALELNMPEIKIDLDDQGRVSGAHVVENTESHQIIEEFMLAANEAVAARLSDQKLLFIRRIHEAPDPRKLEALTDFVKDLGIQAESLSSRFAIRDLLSAVREMPQERAVNYAVLRSMQKAVYSPAEEGHYALASECYCHFTSPIRRYPDLTIHRLFTSLLTGKKPSQNLEELTARAEHCSEREQRATSAERELTKTKLLNFMSQRIGEEMDGIITGVEDFGLFVQGLEIPAEGFVHISALTDDYYHFDRATHSLTGHRGGNSYRLGGGVRVAVARVDVDARELDLRVVHRLESLPSPKPRKSSLAGRGGAKRRGTSDSESRSRRPKGKSGKRPRK